MTTGQYFSQSKGEWLAIDAMPTRYIDNAAKKLEAAILASTIAEPELERQLSDLRAESARRALEDGS